MVGRVKTCVGKTARISVGIIVLNGEPFTRYNLRSLYPWTHQIVVVEGACHAAVAVATPQGHSMDGTMEVLRRFQREEDPEHKLTIVTAEDEGHPNGFWPGEKHEMSQAYAKRVTGNYLWQIDVDEFYRQEDMPAILEMLNRGVDAVTFPTLSFWGGMECVEDGEYMRVHKGREFHRLFRWENGFRYATHRPPTVVDLQGRDLRRGVWVRAAHLEKIGIHLYHYSMLLPKQVREKCSYYSKVDWASFQEMERWMEEVFCDLKHPFAVCNSLHTPMSWLEEYAGPHPEQVLLMMEAIRYGRHPGIEIRRTDDIAQVLRSPVYRIGRLCRKVLVHIIPVRDYVRQRLARLFHIIRGGRQRG
jgi:hypothetical protein